jgi:branched-subunit amino acid transport protein
VRPELFVTFVGMGMVTYLTRAPLLFALARRRLPDRLERYFAALPIAILTALALPLVILRDGRPVGDPQLLGAVLVAILARTTGNLLVSVVAGVVLVAGLRALVG